MSKQSTYTDQQKSDAVDLYVEHGTAEAARRTGITGRTMTRWAKAAGIVSQDRIEKTEQARDVLAATQAEKREELRVLLLDAPIRLVRQALEAEKARDAQSWMIAAGIGVDKFRLEMGEATEVIITGDMMDKALLDWETELGQNDTA